jgi:hypothetical protein
LRLTVSVVVVVVVVLSLPPPPVGWGQANTSRAASRQNGITSALNLAKRRREPEHNVVRENMETPFPKKRNL